MYVRPGTRIYTIDILWFRIYPPTPVREHLQALHHEISELRATTLCIAVLGGLVYMRNDVIPLNYVYKLLEGGHT